jgi:hypothetical protein
MDFINEYSSENDDSSSGNSHLSSSKHEHMVQFYDTLDYLLDVLTDFIFPALRTERPAIVIAIKPVLDALEFRLADVGVPVQKKKTDSQLVLIDAQEMLAKIMDHEDSSISMEPISNLLCGVLEKSPQVYVYGELVNLLCSLGKHTVAVQLEELWNDLIASLKSITLLCGYDMNNFKDERLQTIFSDICRTHSRVGPSEDWSSIEDTNDHGSYF